MLPINYSIPLKQPNLSIEKLSAVVSTKNIQLEPEVPYNYKKEI